MALRTSWCKMFIYVTFWAQARAPLHFWKRYSCRGVWHTPSSNKFCLSPQVRESQIYVTADGRRLFNEWFNSLRDSQAQKRIKLRLDRLELGNFGDCKPVGQGIFELRIDYVPGYRVYFSQVGLTIVLILCGGDKSTQQQDIYQAQIYWRDYEERQNTNEC